MTQTELLPNELLQRMPVFTTLEPQTQHTLVLLQLQLLHPP